MLRFLQQAQPVPHDFARRTVVSPGDQALDERVLLRWERDAFPRERFGGERPSC